MSRVFRGVIFAVISIVLVICILVAVFGPLTVRRSFPTTSGEIHLPGLDAPVDVYRDQYGIPHIYAASPHDLFFAQGYVHAQDRFWQMDFWRHIGSGKLAEMFGEDRIETDIFLRTLGWARVAQQELDILDPNALQILDYYSEGVNAYLADHTGSELSFEYSILSLLNPDYIPELWTPLNTLTWVKVMAWDLGGNMDSEIQRAVLLRTLSPEQLAEIDPPYPDNHPVIVPSPNAESGGIIHSHAGQADLDEELAALFDVIDSRLHTLREITGPAGTGIGSNSWVISGEMTDTGMPLLANDPHLGVQMPSIWYEVGLHCKPKSSDCPYDLVGFSFAGAPGVIIGHNDRIAWGFTNVGPDVQDLYIERINPDNPNQYEVNGEWVDMQIVSETIRAAGGASRDVRIRYTRHGPVISDTYGDWDFAAETGVDVPENYAISLRWTALEPSRTLPAVWKFDLAQNWEEFRRAAEEFDVPSQNLVYADVEGNIGYQTPSKIPIRAGGDGSLPVPGWTDEHEWLGYVPFEEMPFVLNPPQGYIATANNAVVGADYPYMISQEWDYGYRAQRIVEMIEAASGPIDIAYIQQIQGDNRDLNADTLLPVLLQLPLDDARLEDARSLLREWDGHASMDSPGAAVFEVFWKNLLAAAFHDDMPEDYWPGGGSRWYEVVRSLVDKPDSPWWDDKATPEVEDRDQIFYKAFSAAVDELERLLGTDPRKWAWGDLHTVTFRNPTLGESGIGLIEGLFNRGPFTTSGGDSIVNATGWDANDPYGLDSLPSMRMIVDFSNLANSLSIHPTGQSGHAYHRHYADMVDLWRGIQYHPMLWDRSQIEASAEAHLQLLP